MVCFDEKPVTLHADVRAPKLAKPGREARRDNEYKRRGTANVFCAVEPKAGRHFTVPTPDRSGFEFAQTVAKLACEYPTAKTIRLVRDNLSSHTRKSLTDLYGEMFGGEVWDRFTVHYTPTHGSWLNQAEIEIGLFVRQCLGKRRIPDLETLRRESRAWNRRMNRNRVKINWRFDPKAAHWKFGYKYKPFRRSQKTGQFHTLSLSHFYLLPEQEAGRAVYESVLEKLVNLPAGAARRRVSADRVCRGGNRGAAPTAGFSCRFAAEPGAGGQSALKASRLDLAIHSNAACKLARQ